MAIRRRIFISASTTSGAGGGVTAAAIVPDSALDEFNGLEWANSCGCHAAICKRGVSHDPLGRVGRGGDRGGSFFHQYTETSIDNGNIVVLSLRLLVCSDKFILFCEWYDLGRKGRIELSDS